MVYYHGAIPLDYIFLVSETLLQKGRMLRSIVDKYVIWLPGFEMMSAGMGCFAGSRLDCIKKLQDGNIIGIAPGGGLEVQWSPIREVVIKRIKNIFIFRLNVETLTRMIFCGRSDPDSRP